VATAPRRVLITGGSGFIGTNLVAHLRRGGSAEVRNVDRRRPREESQADCWVRGDVQDVAALSAVMTEFSPTHLVHLGAVTDQYGSSMAAYTPNIDGVRTVLDCAGEYGGLQRAVFASSRLVCALGEAPVSEYDYFPPNFYGRSKAIGESLVRMHGAGIPWVIVRPTSIWGPWGEAPYRDFFLSLARGTYVHPGQVRVHKHYGYVGNVVVMLDRLLTVPEERVRGRTFYLADPAPIEVWAFATAIRQALGLPPPRSAPLPLLRALAGAGDLLQRAGAREPPLTSVRLHNLQIDMLYDLAELSDIVGPLPFSMQDGIEATVAYLRASGDLGADGGRRPVARIPKVLASRAISAGRRAAPRWFDQ